MTVNDLVKQHFERIFSSILLNPKSNLVFEDLIDTSNEYINNLLANLSVEDEVVLEERNNLLNFLLLMEKSEVVNVYGDYDEEIEDEFIEYVDRYPKELAFKFFLIRYQTEYFLNKAVPPGIRAKFYRNVFQYQSELLYLDDFLEESNLLLPILLNDDPPIYYIDIFRKAVKEYPKAILKYVLSRFYEKNGELKLAIEYCMQFLVQIESDMIFDSKTNTYTTTGDNITIEDYVIGLNSAANLFFQNKEYDHALEYCNKLLELYEKNSNEDYSFTMSLFDPLILKCQVYMKQNRKDEFLKEFEYLKSIVDDDILNSDGYKDIVEFSKSLKT